MGVREMGSEGVSDGGSEGHGGKMREIGNESKMKSIITRLKRQIKH